MKRCFTSLTALLCSAAILLCSLPMQALAAEFRMQTAYEDVLPDAEMTFEVYARGWLERETKYAPYDRLLPTFARNRVPGVGGWAPISIILRSTPPQSPARCAAVPPHSLPAHIVSARHPAVLLPDETILRTRPWSSVRF